MKPLFLCLRRLRAYSSGFEVLSDLWTQLTRDARASIKRDRVRRRIIGKVRLDLWSGALKKRWRLWRTQGKRERRLLDWISWVKVLRWVDANFGHGFGSLWSEILKYSFVLGRGFKRRMFPGWKKRLGTLGIGSLDIDSLYEHWSSNEDSFLESTHVPECCLITDGYYRHWEKNFFILNKAEVWRI